ncbi:MAG: putative bifunctional diguanylate cyclase/phosphodiesterase [Lachnospiraceae bacterium]
MSVTMFDTYFYGLYKDMLKIGTDGNWKELFDVLEQHLPQIVKDLHLVQMRLHLITPMTIYDLNETELTKILYTNKEEPHCIPCRIERNSDDAKELWIELSPQHRDDWSDEEWKRLDFLCQHILDACEKMLLKQKWQRMEIMDSLTGVQNTLGITGYGGMLAHFGRLQEYDAVFSNIRNFKYINKKVGARRGDAVLRLYSQKVQGMMDAEERFSRLGGDNFLSLVKKEHIESFLNNLSCVTVALPDSKEMIELHSCMGVYSMKPGDTTSHFMNNSSVAFNFAHESQNHNCIWFRDEMLDRVLHKKEISVLFPQALQNQEFVVYYQPKVTLSNNTLHGAEALVRWYRNGKLVPPTEFIPTLEREGTVCNLDFFVFEQVCKDLRRWLDLGIEPVRISSNFSKVHLHHANFASEILRIEQKYQIDSKYIEIELTETTGVENTKEVAQFVEQMHQYGIDVSIDDFGTGYSSLNLLKDLDVDVIKMDASFLTTLEQHRTSDRVILQNLIHMINELHMEVVAEGVETRPQAQFLLESHCATAQGFLFDRPLPREEFEKRLTEGRIYKKN